ncbi:hypothetical protein GE21DRAFT_9281 [Neurospora crassa]|uniref:Mid2 domain-containing protein n=1 Tax=Neurospora crassa (strain ATCC 24698 / 74-OR23-1A / CBS 708.71 / DSM 1257 / FGSC 987) TaxID=367110 RepID=Q7RZE8_NEUCR|nr:hypothetical protein NCU04070 [Neurospora crassa OR74A]EAA28449.2 hypothetical protein NCU04070 [Neurospora crassa OR74A]KHE81868.1 hypothetical protein GE21DRAFT_9281 [Neurospora crassa]|eukprot:XP_957685.2 hypothetical protein NCU04070 [Neurospora crassa OR74A]
MREPAKMIPTTSSLFAILVYLATEARQVRADPNAPCYFPGGEFAPGYFACQAFNAPVSSCCPAGWTCFSNALCITTTESNSFPNLTLGAVQRGACTNPQWNNYICGSACLDNGNRKGELAACGNGRFCCASDFNEGKCDCSSNDEDSSAFTISAGLVQTIIQVSDTTFTGTPSLSIASTRVSTVKASATGSGTTIQITDDPSSTSLTSSETSSLAPTTTPAAPPIASSNGDVGSDSSGSSSSSNGLKIGLGVGIPVAVLAAAGALAYLLWWKPRQDERARRISQHDHYFVSTDLAENDPHGPAKYEPYRQAAT